MHDLLPWASVLVILPLGWAWRLTIRLTRLEADLKAQRELAANNKAWLHDVGSKVDALGAAVARIEGRLEHLAGPSAAK